MTYCGIDLASKASAVCVLNEQGIIVREQMVATEEGDLCTALDGVGRLRCVVEAAPLAEWVVQMLEEQGHEVIIIDPRRAKAVIEDFRRYCRLKERF